MKTISYVMSERLKPKQGSDVGSYELIQFSGGEPHVKVRPLKLYDEVYIAARLRTPEEFMSLLAMVDACKRAYPEAMITCKIPYIPGGRQDRYLNGEALTVKIYTEILNNAGIDKIITWDPHSEVQTALLDMEVEVMPGLVLATQAIRRVSEKYSQMPLIVFPDTGAKKKYVSQYASFLFDIPETKPWYITADKNRDMKTGKITGFRLLDDYDFSDGRPVIIVDDICDGGGTFIGLGEELKRQGADNIYLYITHGIFSKGFKDLRRVFNHIYTTRSWSEMDKGSDQVEIF